MTIRAYLTLDAGTRIDDYELEINPYHDMSFTGKFLEPEIGLIYFGGRWYEPGIGRFITPDPSEDGINWYSYCGNDPLNNIDPDGRFMKGSQVKYFLWGMGDALIETGTGLITGMAIAATVTAVTTFAPAIAPYIAVINTAMLTVGITVLGVDIYNTFAYLIKYTGKFLSTNPSNGFVRTYGRYFCKAVIYTATGAIAAKYLKAKLKSPPINNQIQTTQIIPHPFSEGGTHITTTARLDRFQGSSTYGNPDTGLFISPKEQIDALLRRATSRADIEIALGLEKGALSRGDLVRIDIADPLARNLRLPTSGNIYFRPGVGLTTGGLNEAIIDAPLKTSAGVTKSVLLGW